MTKILLDTNAYARLAAGEERILDIVSDAEKVYMSIFVLGELKDSLRKAGTPIPINDVWIAAHSIEFGAIVVSYDRHFSKIPQIRLSSQSFK
jgi:tRNA(fMet)-specific endonuclease VapC